jgi:hypothetical protein
VTRHRIRFIRYRRNNKNYPKGKKKNIHNKNGRIFRSWQQQTRDEKQGGGGIVSSSIGLYIITAGLHNTQ